MANLKGSNPRWDHIKKLKSELDVSTETSLGRTLSPRAGRARCREAWYHHYSHRIKTAVNRYIDFWLESEDIETREKTVQLRNELYQYRREKRRKSFAKEMRNTKPIRLDDKQPAIKQPQQSPPGATMKVKGSDGFWHWSDGKVDLGVIDGQ